MAKWLPALGPLGGVIAFIGVVGRREDLLATVGEIDVLGLPAWLDWMLIVGGLAAVALHYSMRSRVVEGATHEWTEEGALHAQKARLQHHREMFPNYANAACVLFSLIILLVIVRSCDFKSHPQIRQENYIECLRATEQSYETCKPIIEGEPRYD